jgi:hypothetical protein
MAREAGVHPVDLDIDETLAQAACGAAAGVVHVGVASAARASRVVIDDSATVGFFFAPAPSGEDDG